MADASPSPQHAYLHGFASGPQATKGVALAAFFAKSGLELRRPDLNRPSFAQLTYTAALAELDAMHERAGRPQWRFVASSMGGYLASRWAQLHPDRVERLVLLCPAFDLPGRWVAMMGDAFEAWHQSGSLRLPDGAGVPTDVHFGLVEDARTHPSTPAVRCPTTIVHGTRDTIVPIESSRAYALAHPDVTLVEVDDAHPLHDSLPAIESEATTQLIDPPPTTVLYWDHFGPSALPTSEHFRRHLDEFLDREGLDGCTTGEVVEQPGHGAAWCRAPIEHVESIGRALRPRRTR